MKITNFLVIDIIETLEYLTLETTMSAWYVPKTGYFKIISIIIILYSLRSCLSGSLWRMRAGVLFTRDSKGHLSVHRQMERHTIARTITLLLAV